MPDQTNRFNQLLQDRWDDEQLVCVGLDPDTNRLPTGLQASGQAVDKVLAFNTSIVDATYEYASAYKPNSAFYEQLGPDGVRALFETIKYIKQNHPSIPVILDVKRGDIGSSNEAYAATAF